MDSNAANPLERMIDAAAAAIFAGATGFACVRLSLGFHPAIASGAAFIAAFAALRCVPRGERRRPLPRFEIEPMALIEPDELLLDDILAELSPDARVVRLFDAAQVPTAGELHANIDRHLRANSRDEPPDAAQALSDALRDLRRSLG
jgi:hypothetical protein